jgi:hypothetical protein
MSEPAPDSPTTRRWPWRLAMTLTAVLFVLGPWPVDDSGFEGSEYQTRTLDRLDGAPKAPLAGPIRVGLAEVDLTPKAPRPLAGFIGQIRTPFVGVDSPCFARALTVESGSGALTILTADLLLINAKLAKATCERAGVRLDQVYFTASHTHGGPGGWGDHPLEMLVAGAYDPAFFDELADRLAQVVQTSRAKLEPAEIGFVQVQTRGRQSNRVERGSTTHDALSALIFRPAGARDGTKPITPPSGTNPIASPSGTKPIVASSGTKPIVASSGTKPIVASSGTKPIASPSGTKPIASPSGTKPIVASSGTKPIVASSGTKPIVASSGTKPIASPSGTKPIASPSGTKPITPPSGTNPIAILVVFGAHATVSHPVPPRLGGDYPSALASELKRRTGARSVLFASGAVGDASPSRPKADSQLASAEALGSSLADDLMAALPSARFERDVTVANLRLDVDLPPVRLPFISKWLRFSPLATWWIADRRTHLHAVRLGPAALVGFPGDYSGHLADRLVASTRGVGISSVATSFDGDFRGYLVSEPVFREKPCYETRLMSFYGPWTGEYLNDLARRMVDRLADFPGKSTRLTSTAPDLAPRIALAALLAASIVVGWRRRRGAWEMASRVGFATVAIASAALLAFEVAPDAVAWAFFGLPTWARMAGLPLGAYALIVSRGKSSRTALLLVSACGLLSASWVVVLMIARGWAKAGLTAVHTRVATGKRGQAPGPPAQSAETSVQPGPGASPHFPRP